MVPISAAPITVDEADPCDFCHLLKGAITSKIHDGRPKRKL